MKFLRFKFLQLVVVCCLIPVFCLSIYWVLQYESKVSRIQGIRVKAESGDAASQVLLGEYYASEGDYERSIVWFKSAADQGDDQAINRLGVLAYMLASNSSSEGKRLYLELERSLELYRKYRPVIEIYKDDLKRGNLDRLHSIGEIYYFGDGAEKDRSLAREYFERSVSENTIDAAQSEYRLGEIYLYGFGVPSDKSAAIRWFERSCKRPNVQACLKLKDLQ